MPRGASKGERRGGRAKGTPNKATLERALIAEQEIERAKSSGRKLAKEYLQEFLPVLAGMAAHYQPLPTGMPIPEGRAPNEAKFEKWFGYVLETASKLAPYESPTFRAIVVAPPPPQNKGGRVTVFTLTIFDEEHGQPPPAPLVVEHAPAGG